MAWACCDTSPGATRGSIRAIARRPGHSMRKKASDPAACRSRTTAAAETKLRNILAQCILLRKAGDESGKVLMNRQKGSIRAD